MASLRSFASSARKHAANTESSSRPRKRTKKAETRVMDEVELDLYGPEPGDEDEDESESEEEDKADNDVKMESDLLFDVNMEGVQSKAKHDMANPEGQSVQATHWCVIYRSDGALEVGSFYYDTIIASNPLLSNRHIVLTLTYVIDLPPARLQGGLLFPSL